MEAIMENNNQFSEIKESAVSIANFQCTVLLNNTPGLNLAQLQMLETPKSKSKTLLTGQ